MTSGTTGLLAAFISPALFWGGAAAVSAPILIHLLARRRFKRIRWAAMEFLIDAERRNRRRLRMEEWILLALRCLAVVLIAGMIARPFFQPRGLAAAWGGSQRVERVLVLDDSLSMAYETPEGPVFSRVRVAVRRIIETVRRDTPDDTVTVLRMTAPQAPLDSGTYLDDAQTEALLARVDALTPTQRAIDPPQVIEGLVEVLERNPSITNAAIYIVSDFQRHDWAQREALTSQVAAAGLLTPLSKWAGEQRSLRLVLIDVGEDEPANLAVTDVSLQGGQVVAGATVTLRVGVANFSNRPAENLELQVSVGNLPQPSHTLRELSPHQQASVDLEVEFIRGGFESVRVELPTDALPADNVRYAAVDVATAVRVLLVNGEPSLDSFDDELTFLSAALRPEGEVFSGNEIRIVDEAGLENVRLSTFHAVVLANVYRVSDPAIEALERFVSRGGGLIFFLGDQVDGDLYNTAFFNDGRGLLPAELQERVRAPDVSHLVVVDRLHPVMQGLSAEGDPLGIGQIPFFEYFACRPVAAEDEDTEEMPSMADRLSVPARVVARFDDAARHPAIVEKPFGLGRTVLITTTADREWSHWPNHPTFLPVVMELVRHVSRRGAAGSSYWVGDTIELPLSAAEFEPDVLVRTPLYPNEREVSITATPGGDQGGLAFRWEHTEWSGVYQFHLQRREGGETVVQVAVNTDPRESDLTGADEDELRRTMGDVPFEYVKGVEGLSGAGDETRTEFWKLFLVAAAGVLMTEQWLAWRWGRRR